MSYLIDTCVISELVKKKPNKKVVEWVKNSNENSLFISVLTIGEIQKGITKLPDSKRKEALKHWLDNDLQQRFHHRVLKITLEISILWGTIQGNSEKIGKVITPIDGLIAASGIVNRLTVVTRNVKDMEDCGVDLLNLWVGEE